MRQNYAAASKSEPTSPSESLDARLVALHSIASVTPEAGAPREDRPRTFAHHPHTLYLHRGSLAGLHRVLGSQVRLMRMELGEEMPPLHRVAADS